MFLSPSHGVSARDDEGSPSILDIYIYIFPFLHGERALSLLSGPHEREKGQALT
jgi:hypothetical protein